MGKSKVLVVGGTGYIGSRIVKASLAQGHETYILQRPEVSHNIDKLQLLLSFKRQGAHLVKGSLTDHQSLLDALKKVDVVISAIAGTQFRAHEIPLQLKLVEAIKEVGHIKRFLPSEFGTDCARLGRAFPQGRETFDDKMEVRKAIEDAKIPFTYVSANFFAGYVLGNLCSAFIGFTPPEEKINIYGDGNVKAVFVDEDDVGTYTIKTIDDPRSLNKTLYLRPPRNILTQGEVVDMWERLSGKKLEKSYISQEDFLASMEGGDSLFQATIAHWYLFFYEGCLANFEIGEEGEEASKLYPEVQYTTVEEYLKLYI